MVARRGKDSPYLFYCLDPGHNMPGTMTDPDYVNGFIFRLKLKLPKFANGLYRKWKVGEASREERKPERPKERTSASEKGRSKEAGVVIRQPRPAAA